MRWVLCLLLLGALPLSVRADEPHLEFVERLRSAGLADLAADYLDQLAKKNDPALAARLPLERAKTLVALAEDQDDDKKRDEKLNQARTAFLTYLNTKPEARAAADARFELARLLVRQGKYRVQAARRLESTSEKQDALAKARQSFEQAGSELKAAELALQREQARAEGTEKAALERRINEAKFELGLLTLHKAHTFSDQNTADLKRRTSDIQTARKLFLGLAELDPNDPLSWRAYVEAGRCWMELDNGTEAKHVFESIAKQSSTATPEVTRTARYYELLLMDRDQNDKNAASEVIRGCDEWLSRYRSAVRTPEGQGILFLLATNLIQQGQPGVHTQRDGALTLDPSARTTLTRAEKHLKELAANDSEYTRKATSLRSEVLLWLTAERAAASIARLTTFDECFITAQVEFFQMGKAKAEAESKRHLRRAIEALQRGNGLATRTDDQKDVFTARVMLSYLFLLSGDPYSAAILGEHLAVNNLTSPRGVKAAQYALNAYATILGESKNRNASPDEIAADTRRLWSLADLVLKNDKWKDEPETDAARFQLGSLYFDDRNYRDAYAMFADIKESFPAYALARYRQGAAAQMAQSKDYLIAAADKKRILGDAIVALSMVSEPTEGSSTETVIASYEARLQLGQLLMLAGENEQNYVRVQEIGERLKTKLTTLVDSKDPAYPQLEIESERARVAGVTGQAYLNIKNGKYDEASRQLEPLITAISKSAGAWQKSPHAEQMWFQSFLQTQRDVVLLDARANILAGKADEVKKCLANLQLLTAADKQQATHELLLRLVLELKKDLDKFKKANDAEHQRKLEDGLVGFLDEMSKPKDLSPDLRVFLAQGYSAIDRHDKAAELLITMLPAKPEDEAATRTYRFARLTLAQERRLERKFTEAKAVLREIMGTPTQKGWGFDSFEVRREAIMLLEAEGSFAAAVKMALDEQNKLFKPAQEYAAKSDQLRRLRDDARTKPDEATKLTEQADLAEQDVQRLTTLRERFFEFYYLEVRAILRNAQKNNDAKSKESYAKLAARLVKLEQGQPDLGGEANRARFKELIEDEPALKEKYIAGGGKLLVNP